MMSAIEEAYAVWTQARYPRQTLKRWFKKAVDSQYTPPGVCSGSGYFLKLKLHNAGKAAPAGFVLFCSRAGRGLPNVLSGYLTKSLVE